VLIFGILGNITIVNVFPTFVDIAPELPITNDVVVDNDDLRKIQSLRRSSNNNSIDSNCL